MPPSETKDRILDAAERVFAEHGFEGASLRRLTAEAGVNLAAVHYHFGSKEGLFGAVFERRVGPLNAERIALLDALEAADEPPALEPVLEAMLRPALRLRADGDPGLEAFLNLLGRLSGGGGGPPGVLQSVFAEVQRRFVPALQRAVPELPLEETFWRLHFTIGALCVLCAEPERFVVSSGGRCDASDAEASLRQLVAFAAAGFRAAAPAPDAPSPTPAAKDASR